MSVHKAITEHSKKQHQIVKSFFELDQMRERYIDEAVKRCLSEKAFTTDKINEMTTRINELAKKGIAPTRRYVTKEMVEEYAEKLKKG